MVQHSHAESKVSFPLPEVERAIRRAIEIILDGRMKAGDIPGNAVLFASDPLSDTSEARLDLDSLDALELRLSLEAAFGTEIPAELEVRDIRTVDDLCRVVSFSILAANGGPNLTGDENTDFQMLRNPAT